MTYYEGNWKTGDLAIYSDFGLRSLFIVRVLDWPEDKPDSFEGKFGIVRTLGSVRAEVIDTTLVNWDFPWGGEPLAEHQADGTIHYYHYTNLFHSIEELIGKESTILSPLVGTKMLYDLRQHFGWILLAAYGLRTIDA